LPQEYRRDSDTFARPSRVAVEPTVRIGVDFDNTIVSYDALFHRVALERSLIPSGLSSTKLSVRDYLRQAGKEDVWTEMQGYVYGARMDDAVAYSGAIDFFSWARIQGLDLAIVSHKTRYPFIGHPYDLHEAARSWVTRFLIDRPQPLIKEVDVYFEVTKEEKLARISELGLDFFIDDLPEILLAPRFPPRTARMLFDPDGSYPTDSRLAAFPSWNHIKQHLQSKWTTRD
jgi:hypothetical protein